MANKPDAARRKELKTLGKGGGLLNAAKNLLAGKQAEVAQATEADAGTTNETKPEEPKAETPPAANGKSHPESAVIEPAEAPKAQAEPTTQHDEYQTVASALEAMSQRLVALETQYETLQTENAALKARVTALEGNINNAKGEARELVKDTATEEVFAAMQRTFPQFAESFRAIWDPRLAALANEVRSLKEMVHSGSADEVELRNLLPQLRARARASEEIVRMHGEVMAVYNLLAEKLGAEEDEQPPTPTAPTTVKNPFGGA